jgi:hypothetical protein
LFCVPNHCSALHRLGLDKAVEEGKSRMSRYGVTPNMLVVPPQLMLYMALAPNEKIEYNKAGPAGPGRFEAGVAGYEARAFRGLGVFTSTPYEVNDDTDSLQMLQRSSQVGEFYRMAYPATGTVDKFKEADVEAGKGQSAAMDIVIYDEEGDKHQHITFEEAVKACPATDEQLKEAFGTSFTAKATAIKNAKKGEDPGFEVVIVRPFIEHHMMSTVMTVAGRDTGATLFGPADMQISANTSVKTIEGHYTCHTKSVITKPQNVLVMRDVMCSGYVAGGNTRFFGQTQEDGTVTPVPAGGMPLSSVTDAVTKRLTFGDDASGEYDSMLSFIVPKGDGAKRDQVLSITSRVLPWEVTRSADSQHKYFPGEQKGYSLYRKIYNLDSIHYGEDVRAAENQEFISQGSVNNSLCFVGPHRIHSPWSTTNFELVPGQGHFGPDALPGDARWRRGESVSLNDARNAMVSLEAAAHSQMVFQRKA